MPPKSKAAAKAKGTSISAAPPPETRPPPRTVNEQSLERFYQSRVYAEALAKSGISGLSVADRVAWASTPYLCSARSRQQLSNKGNKELWRHANEASLPVRVLSQPAPCARTPSDPPSAWGRDRSGRDVGDYTLDEFRERSAKRLRLTALEVAHFAFLARGTSSASEDEIAEEKRRRADMATLRTELYGQRTGGAYAEDPEWDDVAPLPMDEPEGALAAIAYPESYAEAISYLRAVMLTPEYSSRCLRLTEHVISLNPAHYTVWLYRFSIVSALKLPVAEELAWLNKVALENLKNYQIWHHRFLLAEHYYPQIAGSADQVADFARSEMDFLTTILAEDTKNYHVWSYRQYLVRKLGYWTDEERRHTEAFIRQDVRNNSAWSHRFFLVFADPAHATVDDSQKEKTDDLVSGMSQLNISPDPAVPDAIIERETTYAEGRILVAPQNESPWNYLRGVLAKGGRPLGSIEAFASQFVEDVGGEAEVVKSTHALDVLATISAERGDTAQAELYLQRLAEKWDPIRAGYWAYRKQQLQTKQ